MKISQYTKITNMTADMICEDEIQMLNHKKDLSAKAIKQSWPKILLVEDNEANIKITTLMLREMEYTNIQIARTGNEALEFISTEYDLVILDVGLPDMSGVDVCLQMRKLIENKRLPIICHTAFGESEKQQYLEAGMNDYIAKPINFDDFTRVINNWLKNTNLSNKCP